MFFLSCFFFFFVITVFLFVGGSKSFFWSSMSLRLLLTFLFQKIQFFGPSRSSFCPSLFFIFFLDLVLLFFPFSCLKNVFLYFLFSDDIGRESWNWVGPPAWERACCNSPEWGGGSSPVKTERPQIVLLLLLNG